MEKETSQNYQISVIMPVYNAVSKTVNGEIAIISTIESYLNQKDLNSELIIVDDKSSDVSWMYLNEKFSSFPQIKFIQHKVNQGPSAARNTGLASAQGEYVFFMDADDILASPQSLSILYAKAKKFGSDLIIGKYTAVGRPVASNQFGFGDVEDADLEKHFIYSAVGPWSRLFRRKMLLNHNIIFPLNVHFAEDFVFLISVYNYAKKISISSEDLHYIVRKIDQESQSYYKMSPDERVELLHQVLNRSTRSNIRLKALSFQRLFLPEAFSGPFHQNWPDKAKQFEVLQKYKKILIESNADEWIGLIPDKRIRVIASGLVEGRDFQDIIDVTNSSKDYFDSFFHFNLFHSDESNYFEAILKFKKIRQEMSEMTFKVKYEYGALFVECSGRSDLSVNIFGKVRGTNAKIFVLHFDKSNILKVKPKNYDTLTKNDKGYLDLYFEVRDTYFSFHTLINPNEYKLGGVGSLTGKVA